MVCSEMPGPRKHTRDIPTCPASTSPVHCTGAATRDCAHACAGVEVEVGPGHLVTTAQRYSDRTVCSTASPTAPCDIYCTDPRPCALGRAQCNTHRLPACAF